MAAIAKLQAMSSTRVVGLRCEHLVNPLGLGVSRPRLSWRTETDAERWLQSAYQIEVRDPDSAATLWNSGEVDSGQSVLVSFGGPTLTSRQRCQWRARVWDQDHVASEWSDAAWFEVGLLGERPRVRDTGQQVGPRQLLFAAERAVKVR